MGQIYNAKEKKRRENNTAYSLAKQLAAIAFKARNLKKRNNPTCLLWNKKDQCLLFCTATTFLTYTYSYM